MNNINNEIKSLINESKFISIKCRNKIIKMLGEEFDINLKVENYENIDVRLTDTGNIIMRDEEYKRKNPLSKEEVKERFNNFKEKADNIINKKQINFQNINDKNNIINLIITTILLIIYIGVIILAIRWFIYGYYFRCILVLFILSTYFIPSFKDRINMTINFIKRKTKK